MPFVEHEQADIIEQRRIVAQREVELLRRRDDDVALADGVLIEAADADAAVEGRDGLAERAEGPLERGFGLRRQGAQRGDEHDPLARRPNSAGCTVRRCESCRRWSAARRRDRRTGRPRGRPPRSARATGRSPLLRGELSKAMKAREDAASLAAAPPAG